MGKQWGFIAAPQRGAIWLKARQEGIGGSDIAAVMGVSPYKTRWALWHEKKGLVEPAPVGAAADRGVRLEPVVADWYADTYSVKLRESKGIIFLKARPWARASLDRTVVGNPKLLVEVKTSASPRWSMYPVPPEVEMQCVWQAGIYGADGVDLACLLGGLVFERRHVPFSPALFNDMLQAGQAFMDSLAGDVPPALEGADAAAYAAYTPQATEEWVQATPDIERVMAQYREAKHEQRLTDELVGSLEIILKQHIGAAAGCAGNGWLATWRQAKPTVKVDWEAVAADMKAPGDLIDVHTTEREGSRRFMVREVGE